MIDVFSKYVYVECMKNKTSLSVITVFSKILKRNGYFSSLQTDLGTEFTNKAFQSWLKDRNIHFFHTYNREIKASIVERFIRTIKEKLFRYFMYSSKWKYVDVIQKLVHAYNHSFHRSIQCSSAEVTPSNQQSIWLTLYGDQQPKNPKFSVGTRVRLSVIRGQFTKDHTQGWTQEEFEIAEAFTGNSPNYKIRDLRGEDVKGSFYEPELQKVVKSDSIIKLSPFLKNEKVINVKSIL